MLLHCSYYSTSSGSVHCWMSEAMNESYLHPRWQSYNVSSFFAGFWLCKFDCLPHNQIKYIYYAGECERDNQYKQAVTFYLSAPYLIIIINYFIWFMFENFWFIAFELTESFWLLGYIREFWLDETLVIVIVFNNRQFYKSGQSRYSLFKILKQSILVNINIIIVKHQLHKIKWIKNLIK